MKSSKQLQKELDDILVIFQPGFGFGGGSDSREHEKFKAELKMNELNFALQRENKRTLEWIAIGGLLFAAIQTGFALWDHLKK